MKRTLLLLLCILVAGAGVRPVYAESVEDYFTIADIDLFAAAAGDQEIVDYYEQCLKIMNEEYNWDVFDETPPFAERYAPLLERASWLLLYDWSKHLSSVGYLPVPQLGEHAPELAVDAQTRLKYTSTTALGDVVITFSLRQSPTDMQKLYEQCVMNEDRFHVSYVSMQHHEEGVFYMLASEEPFFSRSCQGNTPTRGRARLEANYGRFHIKITFLSETTPEDARAFVEALKIENKALGAAFIE